MEHFFPRIQVEACAQIQTRVKLLGGDADVDNTQIIGGDTVKLLGGYISPSSPGFGTPVCVSCPNTTYAALPMTFGIEQVSTSGQCL